MVTGFNFLAATLLLGAAGLVAADEYFTGDGTSYTLGQVGSGNCNFMSAIDSASTNYVALNQEQWDNLGNCGRCIEVSCIDDQCTVQNKTAVVQVLDRCPECKSGDLDLSPTVYKEITGLDPNRLTVRWRFVDCPAPGNVQVCLKEGSNANWIAVQPTNGVVGVKSVEVNGASTKMLDGAYYYVQTSLGTDLSAVKVSVTSINDDMIEGTYNLTVGACTDTNKQFGSGSSSQSNTTPTVPTTITAAPTATTATPTATEPTQTDSSSSQRDSSASQVDQSSDTSSQTNDFSQEDASTSTSGSTPVSTTATPEETTAPEVTTAAPEFTTATPTTDSPTPSGDTSKCHVRGRRHRN